MRIRIQEIFNATGNAHLFDELTGVFDKDDISEMSECDIDELKMDQDWLSLWMEQDILRFFLSFGHVKVDMELLEDKMSANLY